jgi:hypothetical protein
MALRRRLRTAVKKGVQLAREREFEYLVTAVSRRDASPADRSSFVAPSQCTGGLGLLLVFLPLVLNI